MYIQLIMTLLVVLFIQNTLSNHKLMSWIRAPSITQWGKWGSPQRCPSDSWVGGMALKIDASRGWRDDATTLNAIQLHCINMSWIFTETITSVEGSLGNYRKTTYCPRGFATGYQLRTEKHVATDDQSAVDFKLKCTNFDGSTSNVINSEDALPWGTWSSERKCPSKMTVCGIITQLDIDEGKAFQDETSLRNVDLACCKIPDPAETCQLETKWETIVICPESKKDCNTNLTTGFTEDKKLSEFSMFFERLGFIVDFRFAQKTLKLKAKDLTMNYKSLTNIISDTKISKNTTKIHLNCEGMGQQLVLICGSYKVYTGEFRCVPNGQGSNDKIGLYFQPTSISENILWSYNCNFQGGNLTNPKSLRENCGDLCLNKSECTHFTWTSDGTCWLKGAGVNRNPIEKYGEGLVCGWVERNVN